MNDSPATQYIRQVLHHTEPPPPINARFFYTSPIPIDDPLSPLPPPASGTATSTKQPPKPYSEYDNRSLDKAWHGLRKKIFEYNEERGEKAASSSKEGSRTRARTASSLAKGIDRPKSKPSSPRLVPTKSSKLSLSNVEEEPSGVSHAQETLEGSSNPADLGRSPDTTGMPFVRAANRREDEMKRLQPPEERTARPKIKAYDTYQWEDHSHLKDYSPAPEVRHPLNNSPKTQVAVGASRLHQVEMPSLEMTPIYWTPVNDIAQVLRGTWFYQDTMLPVEPIVANMLEAGYIDLQVWTETWKDELSSAVEVGAEGEAKIVHKLWPDKLPSVSESRPGSRMEQTGRDESLLRAATASFLDTEPGTVDQQREKAVEAACDIIDISTGPGGADNKASGTLPYGRQGTTRTYSNCGVIYASDREARILKPALMPSAYYGRRPLANYIRKGHKLGVPVVRGFDQTIWDKLHPPKPEPKRAQVETGISTSASGVSPEERRKDDADLAKSERPKVTDLILVVHGIGQKLSQRMESWHFTHAINSFRREIAVECGNKEVKHKFRPDMGGIMTLPINWRHSLSFEEGGYRPDDVADGSNSTTYGFTLQDITPDTLPSVRGVIGDVMLDIPYYMSHHQPKMIAAVIKEANRVYKLWCLNNPGFHEYGKVHIIAHSLGSVMSIDILSRQPTTVPSHLADPTKVDIDDANKPLEHLLFNTHNLFLAGSPAGFFLLLRRAQLRPRIDHPSAQALQDPTSNTADICGERGQYGCISVENIYNVVNGYDPVAYQMNAAVDAGYAASLKKAFVPSSTPSFWFSRTNTNSTTRWFRGGSGGGGTSSQTQQTSTSSSSRTTTKKPSGPTASGGGGSSSSVGGARRLPSQVELETHNFTREELAERRMTLLNDNAQIDFFLRYGGGAFEIQYLTMLGAHSAYWGLKDFIRLVVIEIGRAGGSQNTLGGLRAVKKKLSPVGIVTSAAGAGAGGRRE